MNCPKCGKPLAGGASFCMHCGQMLAAAGARPAPQQGYGTVPAYAPATMGAISNDVRKRNTWLAIIVSACILLLLFFGLKASGVLNLGGRAPGNETLQAQGAGPDNSTLQSRGEGATPTLQSTKKT